MDTSIESMKENMGPIESLLKGLPGVRDYVDNELRRTVDKRLREKIVAYLSQQQNRFLQLQRQLLENNGLRWMAKTNSLTQRLQLLIDRIKTASYGYSGLFSDIRIRETALKNLYRFDEAFVQKVVALGDSLNQFAAVKEPEQISALLSTIDETITALDAQWANRLAVLEDPDLLSQLEPQDDLPPTNT